MMTVAEAVRASKLRLDAIAGEESLRQARILVGYVVGIDDTALMLHSKMELDREQIVELGEYLTRRAQAEPLQYILGEWPFMNLPFCVDTRALIPRQETETLVEAAEKLAVERGYKTALDMCCGCGAVGVSLAARTGVRVTVSDISEDCLSLTNENAALNGVTVSARRSDLLRDITDSFDMIVCNPPYLSQKDMEAMQAELRFEPREALFGGADGLDFYRRIAGDYARCLNKGGALLMEIGSSQEGEVTAMFPGAQVIRDAANLPRVVVVKPG